MKVHYVDSDVPLTSGIKLETNCGKQIRNAEFRFELDTDSEGREFNSLTDCRECNITRLAKHYFYGVVEGQEAMTESVA
jgi:hypothetical protein